MVAQDNTSDWRPASEVLEGFPPMQDASQAVPPHRFSVLLLGEKLLEKVTGTLNQVAGTEKLEGFSLREMFSETFQHRTVAEMEEYLIVGTARTTPSIAEVRIGWPKPWLFSRCLCLFGLTYFAFYVAFRQFGNSYALPGLIVMGTFAVPISTLALFFELNTPRNVSLYRLIVLLALGSAMSFFMSTAAGLVDIPFLGYASTGIVEETAKIGAVILIARGPRYKYILNGLLCGAAVGAGFSAFESAGYALNIGLRSGAEAMVDNVVMRGLFAPMHVTWTAMVGGALSRVKGDGPITASTLMTKSFSRVLLLAVILHSAWNFFVNLVVWPTAIFLGAIAWFVILGLVQEGLRQVRDEQRGAQALTPALVLTG
jgi:RsiW-degrading membrane proteinase PrsW (M82 family)